MIKNSLFFTSISLIFCFCAHAQSIKLEDKFQSILDSVYKAHPKSVGIMVHVEAPDRKISWTGVAGYSDKRGKEKLKSDDAALIASNTKTYVATAILRLVELKKIKLSTPIEFLLTERTLDLMEGTDYKLDEITIKHLLSQTGGISDYVDDEYFQSVWENPNFQWTREA